MHIHTGGLPSLYPFILLLCHFYATFSLYSWHCSLLYYPFLLYCPSTLFLHSVLCTLIYRFHLVCLLYVLYPAPPLFSIAALHLSALFIFSPAVTALLAALAVASKIWQQQERWDDRKWTWEREVKSEWERRTHLSISVTSWTRSLLSVFLDNSSK